MPRTFPARRYPGAMTSRFAEQLNAQIGNEFAAHQQYVAVAVHYDALTMP
jgi:ferritin